MSEAATTHRHRSEATDLAETPAGTQALLDADPMGMAIDRLPRSALRNLLVVTVGRDPTEVAAAVLDAGGRPTDVGHVPVSTTPVAEDPTLWSAAPVRPSDLTGISIGISRGMDYVRPGTGWVLIDNLGVLLMHAEERRVFKLLATIAAKCRARPVRGVYAIPRTTIDEVTYRRFRELFDVEVDREGVALRRSRW